ncbi:MAG: TonB-dependent receptor [Pseudomonadota bacterium]
MSTPQFSADIVAFQGRKENFLFRDADGFTVDDGVTTHQGVEVSTRWSPSPRWQVYGNGTWAQHEYDFTRIVGRASEIILPGNEVDTAPSTLGQVGVVFTPSLKWRSELVLTHVGAYFTDAANENSYPGHEVLDLRLGYQLSDRWQLAAAIKNLTDERYATRADFAFGNERYFPGEERHVTASLRTNW